MEFFLSIAAASRLPLALAWPFSMEYFSGWQALGLFAALCVPFVLLGVRSLAGLGPVRRWVALGMRVAVIGVIVLILSGLRWQRQHHDLEVMVVRDISQSTQLVHDYPGEASGESLQAAINKYLMDASAEERAVGSGGSGGSGGEGAVGGGVKPVRDRIGVISFQSDALIDAMPNERLMLEARAIREAGNGTDAASALQLAMATLHRDAMHRILLVWDGNATVGDLEPALTSAIASHIPIDVMPLHYKVTNEVMADRAIAPAWKREGEDFTLEIVLKSTNATAVSGKMTVYHQNEPMDLDPYTAGVQATKTITLKPGTNVERVKVPGQQGGGVHQFRATVDVENVSAAVAKATGGASGAGGGGQGDTLVQNNTVTAFTYVRGKGQVLFIDNSRENAGKYLRDALAKEGITVDPARSSVDQFPNDLVSLENYDAVILANVRRGAGGLSEDQQKMLATYVHELGGGLVMIGGEDTFGAGGWQGSKLEEVLPVNMDIPAQRQIAKGALVLIMHSCEFARGDYWGIECALKAVEALSARDEIGVITFGNGAQWDYPLSEKGDGSKVNAAIKKMNVGDMPSFEDSMSVALNGRGGSSGLLKSDAKQKHVIIISDGDPNRPAPATIDAYKAAKITVSTISVYPHQGMVPSQMQSIAQDCKGKYYGPINDNFSQLPQIFIKEASVVRRSLIQEVAEGMKVSRKLSSSEMMAGISDVPDIYGMVLTSLKRNPQIECPLVTGKNNDPVFAHWQAGLGRAAVFTSDAHNRWAAQWVGSSVYEKFWSQVVRGVSKPPMSSNFDIQVVRDGDRGKVIVEALDKESAQLNFLNIGGQVVGPDLKPVDIRLVQTAPGVYEASFDTLNPGNYIVSLQHSGANDTPGRLISGMAVNTTPELRDLSSNDALLEQVARRTGGRVLKPFDAAAANLFTREGLTQSASPMPVWDIMIPILLGLVLVDVATRRIAWDWNSTKRLARAAGDRVRGFTQTTRQVESAATLGTLKQVREQVAEQKFRGSGHDAPGAESESAKGPKPDPKAKFQVKGVEGDIANVVGGAADKPVPAAPKKIEPKGMQGGAATGAHTGGLLEAKRRAQQKIKEKEQGEG